MTARPHLLVSPPSLLRLLVALVVLVAAFASGVGVAEAQNGVAAINVESPAAVGADGRVAAGHVGWNALLFDDGMSGCCVAPRSAPGIRAVAGAGDELAQGGVYALRDPVTGQVVRTGRTNDLTRRAGEHLRDPNLADFDFEIIARTDVYAQQRGLEQLAHDAYTPALNRIRPISPTNPNRTTYLNAAEDFLSIYGGG